MSDQKESINLQEKSNTNLKIYKEDSRKIAVELNLEDKTRIDSKSKPDKGTLRNDKESDKIEIEQKLKEQAFSDKTLKQDDETGNKESVKIGDTEQKREEQDFSDKTSMQDDETGNKESVEIGDTEQKREEQDFSDKTSMQDDETGNKESVEIGETEQKLNEQAFSDKTLKQDDETGNKESVKIGETEQKLNEQAFSDKTLKQDDETGNKESVKIGETEQKLNEQAFSDKTLKQDDETGNKESVKIGETEQKLNEQAFSDKTLKQDDETGNKKSVKIDGELIPEDKIFIDNKPRAEDGESIALKINIQESGESTPNLSLENKELVDNKESVERINKNLLEDKTCIYNKPDSENGLPPTTTVEKHVNEMLPYILIPLEETVSNRKRYQNQNETSNEYENSFFKKIKFEVTNDNQFQEMWKSLQQNSSNFDGWVNILHVVNCQNIVVNARMAYSKFLELYPLCYGYWKKYANFEKRNNNLPEFKKVLENGLNAIPRSVDLWIYYMSYLRLERSNEKEHIRYQFERSLKMCGFDYRSDQLWHDYISWEVEKNELSNAVNLYYRLLRVPTSNYLKNFFKFQEFIFKKLPEKYLGLPDFLERRSLIITELEQSNSRESLGEDSIPPGEDSTQIAEITEISIVSALRIQIIELWYSIHKETAKEFESRQIFEENIRRNHFHVKELESDQVKNWENYIKFERKEGNHERIIFLYERCLITCASKEGLWLNYLEYLSSENFSDTNLLVDVFKRSLFHHPKSLSLNLKYFDFSEKKGWIEKAIETITQIGFIYPNAKDVVIRMINLARRKQDGTLKTLFEHHLKCPHSKSFSSYIAVKYARFVWKHDCQLNLAFDIINDTIQNNSISVNDNLEIYLMYVELQMELNPKDHVLVIKTIDDIILECQINKQKLIFSKKKVEYIEDYIQDYEILRLAKIEYKNLKSLNSKKKRSIHLSISME
ncbi:pre-mRNA-processing factor 39-like isoform X9 [Aphis gossypii]|uniref:pre-mRNA-processing factor 39-like isoform X9 n=1 Tax=Aphis gossypii TaxID=80765 RepID=UPI00215914FC|nr:pre-mRNA-processing factor 39-like isoform X9 [Aphis gossypii]